MQPHVSLPKRPCSAWIPTSFPHHLFTLVKNAPHTCVVAVVRRVGMDDAHDQPPLVASNNAERNRVLARAGLHYRANHQRIVGVLVLRMVTYTPR